MKKSRISTLCFCLVALILFIGILLSGITQQRIYPDLWYIIVAAFISFFVGILLRGIGE